MYKRCVKCGRVYTELENYCTKCGIELERDANRCSEVKTQLCRHMIYKDGDLYCAYCGALTTYALERKSDREK